MFYILDFNQILQLHIVEWRMNPYMYNRNVNTVVVMLICYVLTHTDSHVFHIYRVEGEYGNMCCEWNSVRVATQLR